MTKDEALDIISEHLGSTVEEVLSDGLPDGSSEDLGYDSQLIKDIALAVNRWKIRIKKL